MENQRGVRLRLAQRRISSWGTLRQMVPRWSRVSGGLACGPPACPASGGGCCCSGDADWLSPNCGAGERRRRTMMMRTRRRRRTCGVEPRCLGPHPPTHPPAHHRHRPQGGSWGGRQRIEAPLRWSWGGCDLAGPAKGWCTRAGQTQKSPGQITAPRSEARRSPTRSWTSTLGRNNT